MSTSTVFAPCTATTKGIGAGCELTGICGDETIITSGLGGFGGASDALVAISIACAYTSAGMVLVGMWSDDTGICTGETITTIRCTGDSNGDGAGSAALVTICIATEPSTEITRDIGGVYELIGICGSVTIITVQIVGSGADIAALAGTCTASAFCADLMVHVGTTSVRTGIWSGEIIITTNSMAARSGAGADSDALVSIDTGCAPCIATTRVIGARFGLIGICGGRTTTTGDHAGAGADSDASAGTCIVNEFFTGGLVLSG